MHHISNCNFTFQRLEKSSNITHKKRKLCVPLLTRIRGPYPLGISFTANIFHLTLLRTRLHLYARFSVRGEAFIWRMCLCASRGPFRTYTQTHPLSLSGLAQWPKAVVADSGSRFGQREQRWARVWAICEYWSARGPHTHIQIHSRQIIIKLDHSRIYVHT
jgi:hypothetical protein